MAKPLKKIPQFRSEDEEREFWATTGRDSTQYLDWSKAKLARFPNLEQTDAVTLRLPIRLLDGIKGVAMERGVSPESLIQTWLGEHVKKL